MSTVSADIAEGLDPVVFAAARGFGAEAWQSRLLRTQAARALVLCARQTGKTQTVSLKALHTALFVPNRDVLIVSPTQRQSDEMLLRVASLYKGMTGQPRLRRDNASEMGLSNGSRVVSLPGSEGGIRGFSGVKLLVLDEAARIPDDVFASILPMIASDGQILALSTPWGRRGWFYELHEDAVNNYERHKVSVYDSLQYTPDRIAEVRQALGSFVFSSDYEVVFGDVSSSVFGTELVRAAFTGSVAPLSLEVS